MTRISAHTSATSVLSSGKRVVAGDLDHDVQLDSYIQMALPPFRTDIEQLALYYRHASAHDARNTIRMLEDSLKPRFPRQKTDPSEAIICGKGKPSDCKSFHLFWFLKGGFIANRTYFWKKEITH